MMDPTQRFSSRVANSPRYRPGYPQQVLDLLAGECGLGTDSAIADVGSGTGLLAELFLGNGNRVYGVEPNGPMREAGERHLARYPRFRSVDGTAEATTLEPRSVDFVVAGQAFHWFDPDRAREEFLRILRPDGWVVLVWNDRRTSSTPFLRAYESLLQGLATDYRNVTHKGVGTEAFDRFFGPGRYRLEAFENHQLFDFEGLQGRLLSSSYSPEPGHPDHAAVLQELRSIFEAHEVEGTVAFEYDTKVYFGRLS